MRRVAVMIVASLAVAGCSAEAGVIDTSTSDAAVSSNAAVETESSDASVDPAPATTEAPTAPEPVTASTEHESRSDDFPDILAAQATPEGDGAWRFDVTVSSPYDSPERYADAWRVVGPDGTEYGIRVLTHDHASEQPFTRSQGGIEIPSEVTTVTIEGRDQANGWGGGFLTVELAG